MGLTGDGFFESPEPEIDRIEIYSRADIRFWPDAFVDGEKIELFGVGLSGEKEVCFVLGFGQYTHPDSDVFGLLFAAELEKVGLAPAAGLLQTANLPFIPWSAHVAAGLGLTRAYPNQLEYVFTSGVTLSSPFSRPGWLAGHGEEPPQRLSQEPEDVFDAEIVNEIGSEGTSE